MLFVTAFITGLLGSLHCMGMCGPIALALPVVGQTPWQKTWSRVVYNIGRVLTYAMLGLLLGLFGFGLKLAGLQQSISIIAGVLIVLMAVFSTNFIEQKIGNPFKWFGAFNIAQLFQKKTYGAVFLIGVVNGLLPCGFVYLALVASVATQQALQGALFMALFGLGTMPLMFAVSFVGHFLSTSLRYRINKVVPVFTIVIGCLFILRGLSLNIPYISPKITEDKSEIKACCLPPNQLPKNQNK